MKQWGARSLIVCFVAAATAIVLGRDTSQHGSSAAGLAFAQQLASAHAMSSSLSSNPDGSKLVAITVDYPEEGSVFPPEITPPTFLWRDASSSASVWTIDVAFTGSAGIRVKSAGERLRIGEIDPRCVSETNELPELAAKIANPLIRAWEFCGDMESVEEASGRPPLTGLPASRPEWPHAAQLEGGYRCGADAKRMGRQTAHPCQLVTRPAHCIGFNELAWTVSSPRARA